MPMFGNSIESQENLKHHIIHHQSSLKLFPLDHYYIQIPTPIFPHPTPHFLEGRSVDKNHVMENKSDGPWITLSIKD